MRSFFTRFFAYLTVGGMVFAAAPVLADTVPAQMSIGSKFADGQCLETRTDATLIINTCNAATPQLVRYDDQTGRLHQGDLCLSAVTRGQPLVARACGDTDDQKWNFMEDGTLRSDSGLCADILNFRKDAGTAVIAWDCAGTDNQKFFATSVKVTAAPKTEQAAVTVPPIKGQPVIATYFAQGLCLNVTARSTVTMDTCERKPAQDLRFRGGASGQILRGDQCLASATKGEPLVVKPCTNAADQDWAFTSEGTLRNRLDVCADILAFQTRAGTDVIAWDCTATDNQKFYPAIAAASGSFSLGAQLSQSLMGEAKITTVSMVVGFSAYNLTGAGGRKISADARGMITGGQNDTIIVGGAGVLTVRFANGLAAPNVKAEYVGATHILPKDWSFFSGDTAGAMIVR